MIRTIFDIKKVTIVLCVIVVVLGILLRVDHMLFIEQQFVIPDLNRDLLVGYHIAQYKEFTLLGPDSTSGLPLYNSPLFFIFTALTGLIFGFTTLGLNIGNLVYQLISVGLIFGTTKNLFSTRAAIIASTVMLLFDIFVNQSGFYWQPHLMQVVYMASLYVLSLGYAKKKSWYIYLSIFIFAASIATHYPSVLAAPVFGIAVWALLFHQRAGKLSYVYTTLFGVLSMAVVFSTAIFYRLFVGGSSQLPSIQLPDASVGYYVSTALYRLEYLISYYLPKADTVLLQYIACALLIAGCVWYFRTVSSMSQKGIFTLLVVGVVFILFGVTVTYFPYEWFVAYPLRYYTAVYIPLTILIGALLAELWSQPTRTHRVIAGGALAALLIAGGSYFGPQPERPHTKSQHAETQFLLNNKVPVQEINAAMLDAIQRLGMAQHFDVVTFDGEDASFFNDRANDVIWFPLEQMTGTQLVALDDAYLRSYRPLGDRAYLLVRCREVSEDRCLYLIRRSLPSPYEKYQVIVEQLTSSPDPSYLLKQ